MIAWKKGQHIIYGWICIFIGNNVTVMEIRYPIKENIDDLEILGNITLSEKSSPSA